MGYVARSVGKPLYADKLTESGKRLNYANTCEEVDVNSTMFESVEVRF